MSEVFYIVLISNGVVFIRGEECYFLKINRQSSLIHKTIEEPTKIINQSTQPLRLNFQSVVWNIGSTLKKLYNNSTMIICPNIITPTMVLNPKLCFNLK